MKPAFVLEHFFACADPSQSKDAATMNMRGTNGNATHD